MTPDELRKLVNTDRVGTHWEDCWKSHKDCAILKAADEIDALRKRLEAAEKDKAWLIEWHRIWHLQGSLVRWALLTKHRLKMPDSLRAALAEEEKP